MKTTIHTKNYVVSDRLKGIIDKKLVKISKYFDKSECVIVCTRVGTIERMELTITSGGHAFRAQQENRSMYSNIDIVLGKIERQIIKNRERLRTILRKDAMEEKATGFFKAKEVGKAFIPVVKKNKAFAIIAMNDTQAELNLATLDYGFFIYADEKTKAVKVMYRRNDGHVGVIDILNASVKK